MMLIHSILGGALLLAAPMSGGGQSAATVSSLPQAARISLSIATKQSTYKVGQKVLINIIVKNVSDEQYCENHFLETGEAELNGYQPDVSSPNKESLPLLSKARDKGMRSRGKRCIDPGETLNESLSLNQLVDLSAVGVYQISVTHVDRGSNMRLSSNIISITITQ
jgi:hypothetical protein